MDKKEELTMYEKILEKMTGKSTLKKQEEMLIERRNASLTDNNVDYELVNKQLEDTMKLRNERKKVNFQGFKDVLLGGCAIFSLFMTFDTEAKNKLTSKYMEKVHDKVMRFFGGK